MYWYLLIAALLNVGLGYAVALAVTRTRLKTVFSGVAESPPSQTWAERVDVVHASTVTPARTEPVATTAIAEPVEAPSAPSPVREEVPQAWLEMLGDVLQTDRFAEAAAHIVRLDVSRYRDELVRIDDALRCQSESMSPEVVEQLQRDLLNTIQDWDARQAEAASRLRAHRMASTQVDEPASALEAALMDQAAHIQDTLASVGRFENRLEPAAARRKLLYEIGGLLDHCHSLRDRTQELLVAVLRQESRLDMLKPSLQMDALTMLRSRAALELMLESWWHDDPHRHRQASVAVIDVDRMAEINRHFGPRVGDRLMAALANLAREGFRRNRGYDVVARFAGQQLFVFLGDTGPQGATTAVERFRQTVQAASVAALGQELSVRISCSVTEIAHEDTAATLFRRANEALLEAKSAGGNRTNLHDGARVVPVTPPTFSVLLHTLRLDCDAA